MSVNQTTTSKPTGVVKSSTQSIEGLIEQRLKDSDRRYTSGRKKVVELLIQAGDPVSITDINSMCPELPRSSVYRHLVELEDSGIVQRITTNDEFFRYELTEEITGHHHHLICIKCGKVVDVRLDGSIEAELNKSINLLAKAGEFVPHGHRLDILGMCPLCS